MCNAFPRASRSEPRAKPFPLRGKAGDRALTRQMNLGDLRSRPTQNDPGHPTFLLSPYVGQSRAVLPSYLLS